MESPKAFSAKLLSPTFHDPLKFTNIRTAPLPTNNSSTFRCIQPIGESAFERFGDCAVNYGHQFQFKRIGSPQLQERFREGRFKSRALLDEAALLSCMAYVDLNPVRAGIRESLDKSEFTSIQAHIRAAASEDSDSTECPPPKLLPFRTGLEPPALPIRLRDYVELVDWTGRMARAAFLL